MNNLKIFENDEFGRVRVKEKDGEFWFGAKDVCEILDYSNHNQTLKRLDSDEKGVISIDTLGGTQEVTFVNEPGLYHLVLGSKKKKAKKFKRWITHEVLPEIRKTGSYLNKPQSIEDLIIMQAQSIKQMKQKVEKVEGEVESVKDSFAKIENNWRDYVNKVFKSIGNKTGDFQSYRKESYAILNRRARCDLEQRLNNKIERMRQNGATQTNINKTNKLDVIEDDQQLTEIYISIVKEFEAKYLSQEVVNV